MSFFKNLIGPSLSAVLLVVAYPQLEWAPIAWGALVPLLVSLVGCQGWVAFGRAYACGFIFFAGTLGWFVYVTYPGAFLLIAYLSAYLAIFGVAFVIAQRLPLILRLFTIPACWVVLEFARSHLLTGFGWVTLGHSQYKNLLLIQIADITGVYGVSFLVVMVNVLIVETWRHVRHQGALSPHEARQLSWMQGLVIGLLCLALGYGVWVMKQASSFPTVKVGVVQPNIPQAIKWDIRQQPKIVDKTIQLTKSLASQKPDIIIWPETSLPGIISESPYLMEDIKWAAAGMRIPLMIGAISAEDNRFYNTALLISGQGQIEGRYDKIHLVPFGEFLPLRPLLGWINRFVPLEDFTPGTKHTIFPAGFPEKSFGVLICFEDTISDLRRDFTKAGAKFFVNMTNDAWFQDTKAPFLHLQAAVFGCVENKRSLVRAANTGVSAFVDVYGRFITSVHNLNGKQTFVAGVSLAEVPLHGGLTFYTKYGDVFAYLCFLGILGAWFYIRKGKYA